MAGGHKRKLRPGRLTATYTTGQIAERLSVSPRLVALWFDSGALKGFRLRSSPKKAGDRRVPRGNLVRFLIDNGMPLGDLAIDVPSPCRVLIVTGDPGFGETLTATLARSRGFEPEVASHAFEAGLQVAEWFPHVLVVDRTSLGRLDAWSIVQAVRADPRLAPVTIVVLCAQEEDLTATGGDMAIKPGFEPAALPMSLRRLVLERRAGVTPTGVETPG